MEIFYFLKDAGGYTAPPQEQLLSKEVDLKYCYVAPMWMANEITENIRLSGNGLFFLDKNQKESLFSNIIKCEEFTCTFTGVSPEGDIVNVLVIGGIGPAIGDAMACLKGISCLYKELKNGYPLVNIYVQTTNVEYIRKYVEDSGCVKEIFTTALPADRLLSKINIMLSFEGMLTNSDFYKYPLIDFFFRGLGVFNTPSTLESSAAVPIRPSVSPFDLGTVASKLLFNPEASSPIRSMPRDNGTDIIFMKALDSLIANTEEHIFVFYKRYIDMPMNNKFSDRITFISPKTFEEYCYVISQMDKIITVDTSTYHIAETFGIPTAVIFTTVEPELRIAGYKHCVPYILNPELLSAATEDWQKNFTSRNTYFINKVKTSWDNFDIINVYNTLNSITKEV